MPRGPDIGFHQMGNEIGGQLVSLAGKGSGDEGVPQLQPQVGSGLAGGEVPVGVGAGVRLGAGDISQVVGEGAGVLVGLVPYGAGLPDVGFRVFTGQERVQVRDSTGTGVSGRQVVMMNTPSGSDRGSPNGSPSSAGSASSSPSTTSTTCPLETVAFSAASCSNQLNPSVVCAHDGTAFLERRYFSKAKRAISWADRLRNAAGADRFPKQVKCDRYPRCCTSRAATVVFPRPGSAWMTTKPQACRLG